MKSNSNQIAKRKFEKIIAIVFFILSVILLQSKLVNAQQTYSWSSYTAGSTTYTKSIASPVVNTMSVAYTESANDRGNTLKACGGPCFGPTASTTSALPFFYNSAWPTVARQDFSSGTCGTGSGDGNGCYCYSGPGSANGLVLAANWANNNNTNFQQLVITFTNPVCGPINFKIFNINQGGTSGTRPFTDNVTISGQKHDLTSVPAADIVIGNTCSNTVTTSGNTKTITGVNNNCANCAFDGSGWNTVAVGATGTNIKTITLLYFPSNSTSLADPSSQYVVITDITTTCSTLPIELINFEGKLIHNKKIFTWQTSSEINNNYFTIEQSKDAENWTSVAKVKGAGNSTSNINYKAEVIDEPGYKFYRLKQTDYDGKFEYFDLITIKGESMSDEEFDVYPNPFSNVFSLTNHNYEEEASFLIKVYDLTGRNVFSIVQNNEYSNVDLSEFSNGIYQLIVTRNNEPVYKTKIVKQ